MKFLISDSFNESLARLTNDEQKLVKLTAFDLQRDPVSTGMQFHKLDRARDRNFWSVRVGKDIRLIVHKLADSLLLCYADHHDPAYHWAERRKLETHPTTGAAQLVEIRETVQEIFIPKYVESDVTRPIKAAQRLFETITDAELLGYGVPGEWLADVRGATAESLLQLADHLPREAGEALLELAVGGKPRIIQATTTNPFEHPDAMRRFRVLASAEELARALDFPWEKWIVFLHPDQRQIVEKDYTGPARVTGSAGTGKTVVALHRAVWLARANPDARVLLTTFSDPLASALETRRNRLCSSEPRLAERIDVYALPTIARRLFKLQFGDVSIASDSDLRASLLAAARARPDAKFDDRFLWSEWADVVDAWQLHTWEAYRTVPRLGRKTRLPEAQRRLLWDIFSSVISTLASNNQVTEAGLFTRLAERFATGEGIPFEYAVVDEAQDLSVPQLRFLAAMGTRRGNGLFFAGDLGQRIFQQPFSWKSLGVELRGRSKTLRVNYRTSHQIRRQADRLLDPTVADVDGNIDQRDDTVSVFNGPPPVVQTFDSTEDEAVGVGSWLADRHASGTPPHEIGVFVRSDAQVVRARRAVEAAALPCKVIEANGDGAEGHVSICTMHLAKGLEFRAAVVMACDDEVIPLQERVEAIGDEADLKEVYDTERHLLYVAFTRARDHLLVTGTTPASEFLDDLKTE